MNVHLPLEWFFQHPFWAGLIVAGVPLLAVVILLMWVCVASVTAFWNR